MSFFKGFKDRLTVPHANVQLKLNSYSVSLGENLVGTLTVSSQEDFDATEIRCEIQCDEQAKVIRQVYDSNLRMSVPREVQESAVIFASKPTLNGPTHFTQSKVKDFALSMPIPAGSRPTYIGIDRRVTWTIKGVVAVHGRPDLTTKTEEIQVLQPTAQPVIQEKEIIREVVMIPCKYCGTLMDQTATACPNCGAKRTV